MRQPLVYITIMAGLLLGLGFIPGKCVSQEHATQAVENAVNSGLQRLTAGQQ
ncbi:MAG: hypothetical protein Q8K75_05345 [Chlamydiales bacterium]|nr:hypothetical protein [Chlamydiales bacterium]